MVANSVADMSYQPLPYSDADTTATMAADCTACAHEMQIPQASPLGRQVDLELMGQAPSIGYDDFPREIRKTEINVSEAAARLASKLHLHLD